MIDYDSLTQASEYADKIAPQDEGQWALEEEVDYEGYIKFAADKALELMGPTPDAAKFALGILVGVRLANLANRAEFS